MIATALYKACFSCFSSPIEIRSRSCTPINTVHNKVCALFVYLSVVFINGSGYTLHEDILAITWTG